MESGGATSNIRMKRARARNKDMISNKLPESIIIYKLYSFFASNKRSCSYLCII